jgi:hypothetical protein
VFARVDYRQQYLNCLAPMTLTMPHNAELPLGQIDLNLMQESRFQAGRCDR